MMEPLARVQAFRLSTYVEPRLRDSVGIAPTSPAHKQNGIVLARPGANPGNLADLDRATHLTGREHDGFP